MRAVAWAQVLVGIALIVAGIFFPQGNPHHVRAIARNALIVFLVFAPCLLGPRVCVDDKVFVVSAAFYLAGAMSYIAWQVYNFQGLLWFSYVFLAMAVLILVADLAFTKVGKRV